MRLAQKIAKAGDAHPVIVALIILLGFALGTYLISVIGVTGLDWLYSFSAWSHIPFLVVLACPIIIGFVVVSLGKLWAWMRPPKSI